MTEVLWLDEPLPGRAGIPPIQVVNTTTENGGGSAPRETVLSCCILVDQTDIQQTYP